MNGPIDTCPPSSDQNVKNDGKYTDIADDTEAWNWDVFLNEFLDRFDVIRELFIQWN